MESFLISLSNTINIFNDNFWMIILISVFLFSKENKIPGLLLIAMNIICGFKSWIFVIIIFLTLFSFYLNPKEYYKREYDKKVRQLERESGKIKHIDEY